MLTDLYEDRATRRSGFVVLSTDAESTVVLIDDDRAHDDAQGNRGGGRFARQEASAGACLNEATRGIRVASARVIAGWRHTSPCGRGSPRFKPVLQRRALPATSHVFGGIVLTAEEQRAFFSGVVKLPIAPSWRTTQWLNTPEPLTVEQFRARVVLLHAFQMPCPGCLARGIPQTQRIAEQCDGGDVEKQEKRQTARNAKDIPIVPVRRVSLVRGEQRKVGDVEPSVSPGLQIGTHGCLVLRVAARLRRATHGAHANSVRKEAVDELAVRLACAEDDMQLQVSHARASELDPAMAGLTKNAARRSRCAFAAPGLIAR
jgi:hypothetical protein